MSDDGQAQWGVVRMATSRRTGLRRLGLLTVGAPALIAMLLCGCGKKAAEGPPSVRPVRFLEVGARGEPEVRIYPGVAQASQEVELAFRAGGRLIELNLNEGDRVEQGAVLARLDPRDFSSRLDQAKSSLESAEAELKAMKAGARPEELREMEAAMSAAQAQLTQTETDLNRAERLFAENAVAQRTYDEARTKRDQARAAVEQARAVLEKGRSGARPEDVEAAEANIRRLRSQVQEAEDALADTQLTAPFSGVIARRDVDNHQTVSAGQTIAKLLNKDTVDVLTQIPERDLARSPKRVQEADMSRVTVVFDNYPDRVLSVSLKEFQTEADADTQTYAVRLSVKPPDDMVVAPGMTATARVVRDLFHGDEGAVVVPAEAVLQTPAGEAAVWVVDLDTMRVHQRLVEAGELVSGGILLTGGLEAGETIAATGVHYLREDMEVRPMSSEGEAQ